MTKETYLKGLQTILTRNDKQIAIDELEKIKEELKELEKTFYIDTLVYEIIDEHISKLKGGEA